MRIVRSTAMLLAVSALQVASASADVSCADPNNLCTGDPCTMTNIDVQSPCTVDFGSRTLIIAGILRVPDGGTLSLTADTIIQQGPIDGRHVGNGVGNGASITLIADVGDLESRGEIDVAGTASTGSIDLQAAGNLLVKDNLVAKPAGSNITATGGTVTVAAAGTVTTDQTAVIDVQGGDGSGGSVSIAGDLGATIQGRVHAEGNPGGTIVVGSSVGSVDLERDLRVQSADGPAGLVMVNGEAGITVNDKIRAGSEVAVGGDVQLTSGSGDVVIHEAVSVAGTAGGSISVVAAGTVAPTVRLNARATTGNGGSIDIDAATISLRKDLEVRSTVNGNGGQISLTATTLLDLVGGDAEAAGKVDGGSVTLKGGGGSGDVHIARNSTLTASGQHGNGGTLVVSAPAGMVIMETKVALTGNGPTGTGGDASVDGVGITINRTRIDADGRTFGGELRFNQSGGGTFLLDADVDARDSGTIEALAPGGNLTVSGRFRVEPAGCVGFSAAGTLNTANAVPDVPITPTCP
jgi:hypothetical protein